ncbi:chondroitin 4-sulfotransferase [Aureococcus anophagefferens]|nr:chondroitin 4-sulfotransferase [Aureococcus anophagefferens]
MRRLLGLPLAWLLLWRACAEELLAAPVRRPRGNLTRTVRKGGAVINYFARKPKVPLTAAERLAIDYEVGNRTAKASAFVMPTVPPPRVVLTRADVAYLSHFVYVDERHRLLFAAVPKAACSEFMRLFHRLRNDSDWRSRNPHFRGDRPLLSALAPDRATEILNDPSWTKAVFFRDPASRLLSAYLDKFVVGNSYSTKVFHAEKKLKFADFVDLVAAGDTNRRYLSNMEKLLPAFQFVGAYEHLALHAEMLLRSLGLWDAAGATGWWRKGRRYRADALFASNGARHRTRPRRDASAHYTPELLDRVRAAYAMDYAMFDAIGWGTEAPTTGAAFAGATRASCAIAPPLCGAADPPGDAPAASAPETRPARDPPAASAPRPALDPPEARPCPP